VSAPEPRLASVSRVRERSKTWRRSIDIDAPMTTGKRYHPRILIHTKSSLRKFSQFDMLTSNSDSSRGSLAGVGKEGEDLGKLRKESSRNAPDHDDHFRLTYSSPPRSPASLVKIWRNHDGLSLRQRNRPVAARGRQYYHILFCILHLFMGRKA
jgi:hypothetical protein